MHLVFLSPTLPLSSETRIPFDTEDGLRASGQSAIALHGELDEAQASAYWLEVVQCRVSACEKFRGEFTQVASANVLTL